jgi:hypothetical protein
MPSFSAHVQFRTLRRFDPVPPPSAVRIMVQELAQELTAAGMAPVALDCCYWTTDTDGAGHDHAARITVEAEPGELNRSFASWFVWQHPRWRMTRTPAAIEGMLVRELSAPATAAAL